MKVACAVRTQAIRGQLEDALRRHQVGIRRVAAEFPAAPLLRYPAPALAIVEMGTQDGADAALLAWLDDRLGDATPVLAVGRAVVPGRIARAFDHGIADFWEFPLEQDELDARLRALLRRHRPPRTRQRIEHAGFVLDRSTGEVRDRGRAVALTAREFAIAWLLFSAPGARVARAELAAAISGAAGLVADRTIEQTVHKLRTKLALGVQRGIVLRGAPSRGYRLAPAAP